MVTIQVGICAPTGNWDTQRTRLRHSDVGSMNLEKRHQTNGGWRVVDQYSNSHNNPVAQLVEHRPFKARVVGSNPTGITNGGCSSVGKSTCLWHRGSRVQFSSITQKRDVVQLGRTLALGARGRWFKSSHLDSKKEINYVI